MILSLTQGSNVPRSTETTITPGELSSQDGDSIENFIYCDGYLNWLDRSCWLIFLELNFRAGIMKVSKKEDFIVES